MSLALKARSEPVRTVSFVPPMVNTSHPDIGLIQDAVQSALHPKAKSTQKSAQKSTTGQKGTVTTTPKQPASQGTTGGAIGSLHSGYAANQAEDLGSAC
ncbi:hypothetical protein ACVW00_001167 [Marmoricola sp. URHA0025 HA25]